MTILIEGQTYDESGQYIAGRTSVMAHPASVYVGMNTDRYFGRENTPLDINLIAVTPESEPIAGQKIDAQRGRNSLGACADRRPVRAV